MGQSVRSMAKVGDAAATAALEADKNGHKKDQDGDVTQFLFGQNSDNSSTTAVPLPSDEPFMSSIVDSQANNIQTDNTTNSLGSGDASARLFSKRPWIGYQPLQMSDSKSQFTTSLTSVVTAASTATTIKGGEGVVTTGASGVGVGGGSSDGVKIGSNSRARSTVSKTKLRKTSSSILNDISFGSLLVDKKNNSSFKDIQEQQGIQKFISLVANSSSHAKTQSDDKAAATTTATTHSPEMEQLITMMKNHKVSEESEDGINTSNTNTNTNNINNNINNGNKNTRSITTTTNNTNNTINTINTAENDLCNGLQIDQSDPKYAYLKSRKILPLPKPRLKKSTVDSNVQITPSANNDNMFNKDPYNMSEQNDRENSKKMRHSISPSTSSSSNQAPQYHNILSNASSFDFSIDKLKQLPLHHQQQRQALDPITIKLNLDKSKQTVNVSAKSKENKPTTISSKVASSDTKPATNTTSNNQQPKRPPNAKKKKKGKLPVQSPPIEKSSLVSPIQHEQSSSSSSSSRKGGNKKGQRNNQQKKKWDDDFSTAPGGFLSSDITLFDNPLSDDWMCLFCQYDVLCYGLEATKRKNGYYRRKRERLQREASRRLMHHEPSDSDDDLVFKDERHIRTS